MGDVVELHGQLAHLEDDHELVENLARFSEGLLSKEAVKKKHRLPDEVWTALGENDRLVELVEDAKLRRIRTGQKSQMLVTKAPVVLSGIMLDPAANAKHKIDSIKVLDQLADNGVQTAAAAAAMFNIVINLGETVERYSKPIAIGPEDSNPDNTNTDVVAAVAMKKKGENDGRDIFDRLERPPRPPKNSDSDLTPIRFTLAL